MKLLKKHVAALIVAATSVVACASSNADDDAAANSAEAEIAASLVDESAHLLVKNPPTLMALEKRGLDIGSVLGVKATTGAELFGVSGKYKGIVESVDADLARLRRNDPKSGPSVDFPHRQFDPKWLRSPQARFELVAVVNRVDRMHAGGCGEFRFIYRLAYTATQSESRLPLTLNVTFPQPDDGAGCSKVAERWLSAKSGTPDALLEGPLANRPKMATIEINFQAVRWPSDKRPDMGGHAEYLLRVFKITDDTAKVVPLENTPRLVLEPADQAELGKWIKDHLEDIDRGTAIVPEKFLATQSLSVGPRGTSRLANQPFSQLFSANDFKDLPFVGTKQIKSAAALMRRLDTMTCNGCHQARSVAGFHMLGEERDNANRLNALAMGRSPHFNEDLEWRKDFFVALVKKQPTKSFTRPFAEHGTSTGRYGSHCGLGDPGFASWTCATGLTCVDLHNEKIGLCMPKESSVGDACEKSVMSADPNSHQDRQTGLAELSCGADGRGARCNPTRMGFPDGMCRVDCTEADFGKIVGNTICGPVPQAAALTKCITVDKRPFKECLATQNNATFLRTCDATEVCRDDYACSRVVGGPPGVGACMPPYFAFQARVDGHLFDP